MNAARLEDVIKPALHTAWQTTLGVLVAWWAASGPADLHAVHNISDAKRLGLSLLAAGAASLLSVVKSLVKQALASKKIDPAEQAAIDAILDKAEASASAWVQEAVGQHELNPLQAAKLAGHPTPGPGA